MAILFSLPQFRRNAGRFTEIVTILLKYGFATWIKDKDPEFYKKYFKNQQGESLAGLEFDTRVRMALSELGTTFIKLGQILSTRDDLIGPDLAAELAKLQSDTPADTPEQVRSMLEAELGRPPEELFLEFDETPLGSASIGQVHAARLKDGPVVVKIQHAGIQKKVETDLDIMAALASLAERYDPELKVYQPRALVAEFRRTILKELDFRQERRNLQRFINNFADDPTITIPRPYPELSALRVLTMQRLEGVSIGDVAALKAQGFDTKALTKQGADVYLKMIFTHGFYHADPHPGNIWVLKGGTMGLLDCGMVGRLDQHTRLQIEGMLLAAMNHDIKRATDILLRIASAPQDLDRRILESDLDQFLADYVNLPLNEMDLSGMLNTMTRIIREHHIILPPNIALLVKTLVMLEGTSRKLNRDFNLLQLLDPYLRKSLEQRFNPVEFFKKIYGSYQDWERLTDTLPTDLEDIMLRVREGRFDVNVKHRRLELMANRLVYGILAAAMFMGSCVLLAGRVPPAPRGVSLLGLAGVGAALFLGWRALKSIRKTGGLR